MAELGVDVMLLSVGPDLPYFTGYEAMPLERLTMFVLPQTGDPVLSKELAWQALANLRQQQASALAYFDCFWVFAVIMLMLVPLILLMKRPVAGKGARSGAS